MPLSWLRKRGPKKGADKENRTDSAGAAPDSSADGLRFAVAPPSINGLLQQGDCAGALQALQDDRAGGRELAEPESDYWEILCLLELGRLEEALRASESAVDRHPDSADLYFAQAQAFRQQGQAEECEEALSMALHYAPGSARLLDMQGDIRKQRKDVKGAIDCYRKSLECQPGAGTANRLARTLSEAKRFGEAEEVCRQTLDSNPEDYSLRATLGHILILTDQYEEAIAIQQGLADLPGVDIELFKDLTYGHYCLGELDQAKYYLRKILSIEPANYDARYYLALIQLAEGDFSEAWDNYRWRFLSIMTHGRHYVYPEWDGTPSKDKRLLVFAEQGLGDQIMFCGCVPQVLAGGQKLVLECEDRLKELMARSFPEAMVVPVAKNRKAEWIGDVGPIDYQIAMGDLPGIYRRAPEAFPDHGGYLKPGAVKAAKWRERLSSLPGSSSIGISWRGGTIETRRGIRSIDPEAWRPLLALPDTNFISLQYGEVSGDLKAFSETHGVTIHHWQEAIDDYDETAALVASLDGVVTVCTAIAHLTGALGQVGWVATPVIPEWRYMTGGERWPWYPQMRLIRQKALGDWKEVMETIARRVTARRPRMPGENPKLHRN